jgi:hypothetical protein
VYSDCCQRIVKSCGIKGRGRGGIGTHHDNIGVLASVCVDLAVSPFLRAGTVVLWNALPLSAG